MSSQPAPRLVLCILDGVGERGGADRRNGNAVLAAEPRFYESLFANYPHTILQASGLAVGLPEGQMGNSEVGHQNIGAGRIVDQEVMRINRRIRDGSFFRNSALGGAADRALESGGRVHVMGLASDIGVHSVLEHLYAVVELCSRRGVPGDRVIVHALTKEAAANTAHLDVKVEHFEDRES